MAAFTHRLATLAAVVAIPVGIAATSYLLTDDPEKPEVPAQVELDTSPAPTTPGPAPTRSPAGTPTSAPTDAVVPGPSTTGDDDADDRGEGPGDDRGDDN
ncbi:small hydrophilic protein [Streptomyces sp. NPDC050504]|uniref:small hydrophilic protein n=1 Tax=Streptomyces sp. NPDC050504 TaxID=3365618 RepID=UPI0037A54D5C